MLFQQQLKRDYEEDTESLYYTSDKDEDEDIDETDEPNTNILLYLGFLLMSIGVIITSVGLGI